jgi:stage V sporulation protein SpoVS
VRRRPPPPSLLFLPRPPPHAPPRSLAPPLLPFLCAGIGADSINQSVKAIIIARNYMVDEGLDCAISSAEVNSEVGPDALTFSVSLHAKTLDVACPEDNTFKCAATTKAPMLAGAIANRIREGAKHLSVTSVGPMAALRNIKAYCIAKTYLEEAGYDFYLVPFFVQVSVGEEDRTGIRLDAFVSKK